MVPAALVESIIDKLVPQLDRDDVIIDGGNSHYHDPSQGWIVTSGLVVIVPWIS
jgi:6-phosphogluconate dehydrogenase (decarboxylating)